MPLELGRKIWRGKLFFRQMDDLRRMYVPGQALLRSAGTKKPEYPTAIKCVTQSVPTESARPNSLRRFAVAEEVAIPPPDFLPE